MRILMAGASGFLGTRLADRLTGDGHEVVRLVRREARGPGEIAWQPSERRLDPDAVAGAGAVVNLAGAGVGDKRWTKAYKRVLMSSRVDPTATLAATIAALPADARPRVLLNSSGISCYGDTDGRTVTEDAPLGEGFLPDVCRAWEGATAPAADAGVRVVKLRTAPVLDAAGGLLKPQLLAYKLGIAGKFGNGRQWTPWIALADWLSAATFLLGRDDIAGPVNIVSPDLVTNAQFTKAMGRALRRPTFMPIPAFAMKVLLGGFSVEVLGGSGGQPGVLTAAGFTFRYPELDAALSAALRKERTFSQAV
jgi:uncharacterized protein (TIGR01777 family)